LSGLLETVEEIMTIVIVMDTRIQFGHFLLAAPLKMALFPGIQKHVAPRWQPRTVPVEQEKSRYEI